MRRSLIAAAVIIAATLIILGAYIAMDEEESAGLVLVQDEPSIIEVFSDGQQLLPVDGTVSFGTDGKVTSDMTGSTITVETSGQRSSDVVYVYFQIFNDSDSPAILHLTTGLEPGAGVHRLVAYYEGTLGSEWDYSKITRSINPGCVIDVVLSVTNYESSSADWKLKIELGSSEPQAGEAVYINDEDDFLAFHERMREGEQFVGTDVFLTADLDFPDTELRPEGTTFSGNFVGGGHTIKYCYEPEEWKCEALFGHLHNAVVSDLNIETDQIGFDRGQAGLAVFATGDFNPDDPDSFYCMVNNVTVRASIGGTMVGGVICEAYDTLFYKCTVKGSDLWYDVFNGHGYVGGVCGTATDCHIAECTVEDSQVADESPNPSEYDPYVGGIVAIAAHSYGHDMMIEDCRIASSKVKVSGAGMLGLYVAECYGDCTIHRNDSLANRLSATVKDNAEMDDFCRGFHADIPADSVLDVLITGDLTFPGESWSLNDDLLALENQVFLDCGNHLLHSNYPLGTGEVTAEQLFTEPFRNMKIENGLVWA